MPGAMVDSFSEEYRGAYSVGGFMKAHCTGASGWHNLTDPSGHMPRLPHGGDLQFVRIIIPVPQAVPAVGPPAGVRMTANYDGTGGAERWTGRTGVTGPSGGHAWPSFEGQFAAVDTEYTFYVEYGRVHSVPR